MKVLYHNHCCWSVKWKKFLNYLCFVIKPTLQKSWNTAWNIKQWDHFHDISHNVPTLLKSSHRGYSQTDTTQPDTVCSVSLEAEQLVQTFKPAGAVALSHSIRLTAGQDGSSWAWTSFVKNIQQKGKGEQKVSSKIKGIRCTQDWKKFCLHLKKKLHASQQRTTRLHQVHLKHTGVLKRTLAAVCDTTQASLGSSAGGKAQAASTPPCSDAERHTNPNN